MNHRTKYLLFLSVVALLLFTPLALQAQGDVTLESLSQKVKSLFQGQKKLDSRVAALETRLAPTPTRTPTTSRLAATETARVTRAAENRAKRTATASAARATERALAVATTKARLTVTAQAKARATPTPAISPALQTALDESSAYEWVNQTIRQLSTEKGVAARKGGWMTWYDGQNMVDVFLYIVDRCDLTGEELVALIEKYERDSVVVAMNEEYEPNLTNEVAIFRDLYRAAQRTTRPCSSVIETFKGMYKKEKNE